MAFASREVGRSEPGLHYSKSRVRQLAAKGLSLILPGTFAGVIFRPRLIISSFTERLGLARALVAVAVIVGGYIRSDIEEPGDNSGGFIEYAHGRLLPVLNTIGPITWVALGSMVILLLVTRPSEMPRTFVDMFTPIGTVIVFGALAFATGVAVMLTLERDGQSDAWSQPADLLLIFVTIWLVVNTARAALLGVIHMFNAADAHPYLPPILGLVFGWLLVARHDDVSLLAADLHVTWVEPAQVASWAVYLNALLSTLQAIFLAGTAWQNGQTLRSGSYRPAIPVW